MGTCRCGHGRVWHRTSANATSKRRRLGLRPTGHLPCTFRARGSERCGCRNWHPATPKEK